MKKFPIDKISPIEGSLSIIDDDVSIEINLKPFELIIDDYSEDIETSIRLDGINIPSNPNLLEEKEFNFPINPNEGYIDGSVYFFAAHNPVDVTKIIFGKIKENRLPVTMYTNWELEFEGTGFKNFSFEIKTDIKL